MVEKWIDVFRLKLFGSVKCNGYCLVNIVYIDTEASNIEMKQKHTSTELSSRKIPRQKAEINTLHTLTMTKIWANGWSGVQWSGVEWGQENESIIFKAVEQWETKKIQCKCHVTVARRKMKWMTEECSSIYASFNCNSKLKKRKIENSSVALCG